MNSDSFIPVKQNSGSLQIDSEAYLELNRWRFLMESLLSRGQNAEEDLAQVIAWIDAHSEMSDDTWEVYSACERVCNLLVYLAAISGIIPLSISEKRLNSFVIRSLEWICQHIEFYGESATNNHILNNARALVIGGVATRNEEYSQVGLRLFRHFLPRMVLKGGFLRERSTHYQLIVTNWVIDAWKFAEIYYGAEHDEVKFLNDFAKKMIYASSFLCNQNGELLALVGDISPDASPNFTSLRLSRLYPDCWPESNVSDLTVSVEGDWFKLSIDNQYVIGNFPAGIYPLTFPTHGHCDYTGFVWGYDGDEILGDTGRSRYTPDEVSLLQKGPLGHNILLIDEFSPLCESLLVNGSWWPKPYANAHLRLSSSVNSVILSHNGFSRATNVGIHTRTINLSADGLQVIDYLEGSDSAVIQFRWNLGIGFYEFDNSLMCAKGLDYSVLISVKGLSENIFVDSRRAEPFGGWTSKEYGENLPSIAVDICGHINLPAVIETYFRVKKCVE
jgi:hypothetical protein